jgi:arsenite methyltransferase
VAELTDEKTTTENSCCSTEAQVTCCEPSDKAACCGESAAGGSCGCSAGQGTADPEDVREAVRARCAGAATSVVEGGSCCDSNASVLPEEEAAVFGAGL